MGTSDGWVSDLRERIEERLGRDQFHWHWTQALQWTEGDKGQVGFGLLTAVHRSLGAIEVLPDELVAGAESWPGFANGQPIAYPMQRVRITGSTSGGWSSPLVLTNVHGVPRPVHKLDSEVRLEQNRRVRQHTDDAASGGAGAVILGDFNLMPDTDSIRLLSDTGMRNLVVECKIETTRSKLNPWYNTPQEQKFADYCFVRGFDVLSFQVPPEVNVSDHLPLLVEITEQQ